MSIPLYIDNKVARIFFYSSHPEANFMKDGIEVLVATIPLYHTFGQLKFFCQGLYLGATMVFLPRFKIDTYLLTVNKYRVSNSFSIITR